MAQVWSCIAHVDMATSDTAIISTAVPSGHVYQAKVWITNRTALDKTFRLRQAFGDAAAANDQYRAYDAVCKASDIVVLPLFILNATDKLYGSCSAAGLSCQVDALDIA